MIAKAKEGKPELVLFLNVQHPYAEKIEAKAAKKLLIKATIFCHALGPLLL